MDNHLNNTEHAGSRNKRKELGEKRDVEKALNTPNKKKKKSPIMPEESGITKYAGDLGQEEIKLKTKKLEKSRVANEADVKWESVGVGKEAADKKKSSRGDVIDSAESPFLDLFLTADSKLDHKTIDANTHRTKKKKMVKNHPCALELSQVDEIGLGGPSAWDI